MYMFFMVYNDFVLPEGWNIDSSMDSVHPVSRSGDGGLFILARL
jgi:hypothetical protein